MMIAVKDDGCQQEQAILHKAQGAVAEVPSAPQPNKPWCLKPWNNLATQRQPHPQSTRTALDEAAPLGTASSQSYINHSASNGIMVIARLQTLICCTMDILGAFF
jgi:hypothetical protein